MCTRGHTVPTAVHLRAINNKGWSWMLHTKPLKFWSQNYTNIIILSKEKTVGSCYSYFILLHLSGAARQSSNADLFSKTLSFFISSFTLFFEECHCVSLYVCVVRRRGEFFELTKNSQFVWEDENHRDLLRWVWILQNWNTPCGFKNTTICMVERLLFWSNSSKFWEVRSFTFHQWDENINITLISLF